ncbi:MAG: indole-3-glycerol phosphate synthase TrpC [Cyclobacteriaceae bacterium]|nr:indole-3-glycerol phosphate synthase TrpC [Cyclobacteriaceae bacterium]MCB0500765.1 indole-3-glycerol phosphate synthase TrpC [Cyclobacteriaceae bacterium]MCB9236700.1 indole-3-glycerol phosphate synthase TrpC [Flammeovirgaceae bacterium]MCO5272621.1 indole-3-glycerol phosphate synthase TrpC [Cyclobacteriaceae bacterium]MCW5901979.1 indole-3-glycerol phosphate synthase TrpC [Cyclobacteriaceae bacterium]
MRDILAEIVKHKQQEVAERKSLYPVKLLEQGIYFGTPSVSLKQYIKHKGKSGVIAEIKRKSPSKGDINPYVSVERTSIGYMQAGASALSVLTDKSFFGGSSEDLTTARKFNFCPILRKDFVIDEYQVIEAKSMGADAVLLIAAILPPGKLKSLCAFAHSLQMEVLLEVHDGEELKDNLGAMPDVVGVNNRNLKTFEVSTELSQKLIHGIPSEWVKVSESGIGSPAVAAALRALGFDGFLIGELFMQSSRPEMAAMEFIRELARLEKTRAHEGH